MGDPEQGVAVVTENISSKKERKKRRKRLLKDQLHEFGQATTLHGLLYITNRELSLIEKIFWFIVFLASFVFCVFRIHEVWVKWEQSPIIVTVNERLELVENVPFPSITICPEIKTYSSVFDYASVQQALIYGDGYASQPKKLREMFEDLIFICNDQVLIKTYGDILSETSRNSSVSIVQNLLEVAPKMNTILIVCNWRGHMTQCLNFFKTVITEEGVCFNMNSLPDYEIFKNLSNFEYLDQKLNETVRGWTSDGYYDLNEKDPYPRRGGRRNKANPDLMIKLIHHKSEVDKKCNIANSGYKLYIQHPQNMPSTSMHQYDLAPGMKASFALKLNIFRTEENVQAIASEKRQCFFPNERQLRYFKTYTSQNCMIECLTNITYKLCDCVAFYMPRQNSQEICHYSKSFCILEARAKLEDQEAKYMSLKPGDTSEACNCLPSCNSVDYDADVIISDYYNVSNKVLFTDITIFYKEPSFISLRRSELFDTTDFLANCGGLLGLFMGFSFISVVEIIYFATLRLGCAFKRDAKKV